MIFCVSNVISFYYLRQDAKIQKKTSLRRVTTGGIKKGRKRNNAIESDHYISQFYYIKP